MPRRKTKTREREPFLHARLDCYYFWMVVGGKRKMTRLSKDKTEAWKLWHELRAKEETEAKGHETSQQTVQRVIALFLLWLGWGFKVSRSHMQHSRIMKRIKPSMNTMNRRRDFGRS